MIAIGIDPGKSGAVVALKDGKVKVCRLDQTERDIAEFFDWLDAQISFGGGAALVMLERASAMPGQGVSSTFKFGTGYGFLRGCIAMTTIPMEEVAPAKWQRVMGCLTKGDKRISRARAQQLFPVLKVVHANADALLIAEYCRRLMIERGLGG